jgi:hypothetical protein
MALELSGSKVILATFDSSGSPHWTVFASFSLSLDLSDAGSDKSRSCD